jgi:hypothetical protein
MGESTYQITITIDVLILSDEKYMSTMEGIHCAIMQGYLLNEAGQIKRAWQTWRKAIQWAYLMGLHTNRRTLEEDRIWWTLYTLDRNASLLLGRPYAISDQHSGPMFQGERMEDESPLSFSGYHFRLSRIAGKCIDHMYNPDASTLDAELAGLDLELQQFAKALPADFWKVDAAAPKGGDMARAMAWRYKLLNQLTYHQLVVALYLGYFMKANSGDTRYKYLRGRCIQAARTFLRIYLQFRHPSNRSMIKSRAFDPTACSAVMILLLGLWNTPPSNEPNTSNNTSTSSTSGQTTNRSDWVTVQACMQLYKSCYSSDRDEKAAFHSYNTIQLFHQTRCLGAAIDMHVEADFTIPLFQSPLLARLAGAGTALSQFGVPVPSPLDECVLSSSSSSSSPTSSSSLSSSSLSSSSSSMLLAPPPPPPPQGIQAALPWGEMSSFMTLAGESQVAVYGGGFYASPSQNMFGLDAC